MPENKPEQGPPEITELFNKIFKSKKSSDKNDNGHITRFASFIIGLIVLLWGLSGIFIVDPAEQSVVLRFGKYVSTIGPGIHWIPRFIDSRYTIDVQQVRNFPLQEEMLTRDENIVNVDLAVQYRINNPRDFLFNVVKPVETLKHLTSSAMRQVVGEMTLDSVLTTGRDALREDIQQQLDQTLKNYRAGIAVTDVTLQPVKPPEAVTAAFDDAIKAREDKQSYINKATAYSRRVMSIAQGRVARLLQSANAYKQEVVLQAKGDVARYLALLKPYEVAPKVTEERLYLDAMTNVLSHSHTILLENGNSNILYLPLQQLLGKTTEAKTTADEDTPAKATELPKPAPNPPLDYGPSPPAGYE